LRSTTPNLDFRPHDRIVVTGAEGFIGSHLVDQLRRALPPGRVFSIVHHLRRPRPHTWACDLTDLRALRKLLSRLRPTWIFHAAGRTRGTPEDLMRDNLLTTATLLQAAEKKAPSAGLVLLGSAAECGDPLHPYSWAKRCQTRLAQHRAAEGQKIIIARLFNLTGPGIPPGYLAGSIAQQVAEIEHGRNRPLQVRNLSAQRDFLDVRDAVRGILVAAKRGQSGQIYEVCSGRARRAKEVLTVLRRLASRSIRVRVLPSRSGPGTLPVSRGNPEALRRWKWAPRISFADSLSDTLRYYRDLHA